MSYITGPCMCHPHLRYPFSAEHACQMVRRLFDGKVVFLRSIRDGAADRSYGIHVAELAGLPNAVVDRANEVLKNLESGAWEKQPPENRERPRLSRRSKKPADDNQLMLFELG